jgi:HSP20 family protein
MTMANEDDFEIIDEMDRRVRAMIDETFGGAHASFFDVDTKSLKPLFKIEVTDDEVVVTFDLPYVEKGAVELHSTEDSLSIQAKMRMAVSLQVGGPFQRRMEFEQYSKKIRLPVKVDPNRAKAEFANGMLTITYPVLRKGGSVRIR